MVMLGACVEISSCPPEALHTLMYSSSLGSLPFCPAVPEMARVPDTAITTSYPNVSNFLSSETRSGRGAQIEYDRTPLRLHLHANHCCPNELSVPGASRGHRGPVLAG